MCETRRLIQLHEEVGRLTHRMGRTHPVHDVIVVQEGHALQQHQHVAFDLSRGQGAVGVPDDLRQVRHHEVKDQHEAGALREDALELHHLQAHGSTLSTPTGRLGQHTPTCSLSSISCRARISLRTWLGMPSSSRLRDTFFSATVSPVWHTAAFSDRGGQTEARGRHVGPWTISSGPQRIHNHFSKSQTQRVVSLVG